MLAFLICKPCTVDYAELVLMRDCLWPYYSIDKNTDPGQYPKEGETMITKFAKAIAIMAILVAVVGWLTCQPDHLIISFTIIGGLSALFSVIFTKTEEESNLEILDKIQELKLEMLVNDESMLNHLVKLIDIMYKDNESDKKLIEIMQNLNEGHAQQMLDLAKIMQEAYNSLSEQIAK
jgi:hypothetical protein